MYLPYQSCSVHVSEEIFTGVQDSVGITCSVHVSVVKVSGSHFNLPVAVRLLTALIIQAPCFTIVPTITADETALTILLPK